MPKKIELITRAELGRLTGNTRAGVSYAVLHSKKLKDVKHDGETGININDSMTHSYVAEQCVKNGLTLPPQFQQEKSDVQLFMDAVDHAWDECVCGECMDMKRDFQTAVVEYVKREKG